MTDFALREIDDAGTLDLVVFAGDFIRDDSLRTGVLLSLGTDAEVPDAEGDRRGWWGDALASVPGDRIGSTLWLYARENATPEIAQAYNAAIASALQWCIDDGLARAVSPRLAYDADSRLVGLVDIERPQGRLRVDYDGIWTANFSDPLAAALAIANDWAAIAAAFIRIRVEMDRLAEPNGYIQNAARIAALFEHIWLDLLPET